MQGIIQQAQPSKSGKTLSVQIGGQWYSTKHFELQNMVGQSITFQTSQSEFNGTVMHWLNDYTSDAVSTTPAGQAFDQAMAQQQPMGAPVQAPPVQPQDKDLHITSLALVKCIQGIQSPQQAVEAFWETRRLLAAGEPAPQRAAPPPPPDGFDDDIPF